MTDIPVLTKSDLMFLRELKREHDKKNQTRQTLTENRPVESAQSNYIVRVPEGGIPGLVLDGTGYSPGFVRCEVMRLIYIASHSASYLRATGQTELVYNKSGFPIPEGLAFAKRDAFGTWWGIEPGEEVAGTGTGTGTGTGVCITISGIDFADLPVVDDAQYALTLQGSGAFGYCLVKTPLVDCQSGTGTA